MSGKSEQKESKSALMYRLPGPFPRAEDIVYDERSLTLWTLGRGHDNPKMAQGYPGAIFVYVDEHGKTRGEGYLLPAYNPGDGQDHTDQFGEPFPTFEGDKPFFAVSETRRGARIHRRLRKLYGFKVQAGEGREDWVVSADGRRGYIVGFGARKGKTRLFCWLANRAGRNRRTFDRNTLEALECSVAHLYDDSWANVKWEEWERCAAMDTTRVIEQSLLRQLPLEEGQLRMIAKEDEDFSNEFEEQWLTYTTYSRDDKNLMLLTHMFWLLRYLAADREEALSKGSELLPEHPARLIFVIKFLKQNNQAGTKILTATLLNMRDRELAQQLKGHPTALTMDQPGFTSDGSTLLMMAARAGYVEVVAELIAAGVDIDAVNDKGLTALQLAQQNQNTAAVKLILQAQAAKPQQELVMGLQDDKGQHYELHLDSEVVADEKSTLLLAESTRESAFNQVALAEKALGEAAEHLGKLPSAIQRLDVASKALENYAAVLSRLPKPPAEMVESVSELWARVDECTTGLQALQSKEKQPEFVLPKDYEFVPEYEFVPAPDDEPPAASSSSASTRAPLPPAVTQSLYTRGMFSDSDNLQSSTSSSVNSTPQPLQSSTSSSANDSSSASNPPNTSKPGGD